MNRLELLVCLIASASFGCSSNIVVVGESPFAPGIYSGQSTCDTTVEANGIVQDTSTSTSDFAMTISTAGLPVYDGKEVAPGVQNSQELGGSTLSYTVSAVTVADNGVLIDGDGYLDQNLGDGTTVRWSGGFDEQYLIAAQGKIEYTIVLSGAFTTPDGTFLSMSQNCGGTLEMGDGVAGSSEPATLTTKTIRQLQAGDYWRYDERRDGIENGQAFTLIGTVTASVLADTVTDLAGNEANVTFISANFVQQEAQVPFTSVAQVYYSQGADGTLYVHGFLDDSVQPPVSRFVIDPPEGKAILWGSPMGLGSLVQTNFIEYGDGTTETVQGVVVAIENITVPAGTFAALRIEGSGSSTLGMTTTTEVFTSWFVPELGAYAMLESTRTIRDDSNALLTTFNIQSALSETNVPHSVR